MTLLLQSHARTNDFNSQDNFNHKIDHQSGHLRDGLKTLQDLSCGWKDLLSTIEHPAIHPNSQLTTEQTSSRIQSKNEMQHAPRFT